LLFRKRLSSFGFSLGLLLSLLQEKLPGDHVLVPFLDLGVVCDPFEVVAAKDGASEIRKLISDRLLESYLVLIDLPTEVRTALFLSRHRIMSTRFHGFVLGFPPSTSEAWLATSSNKEYRFSM
jgi:hypothetical protein